jgi:hypothetical protein
MVKKLIKLIKKLMQGYDIDTLVSIKNSFQGNNFQWVKTNDRAKLGQVVRVNDVIPSGRGFIAQLSDGSRISTDQLTSNLMMLMDDQPALSMAEIMSINILPSLSDEMDLAPGLPDEFKDDIARPAQVRAEPTTKSAQSDPADLFGMFSLEQTDLPLSVSIKLPARNLLKMMYSNSQNKEEFLNKLAVYINSNVTTDSIKSSMKKSLDPDKKKKV